MNILIWIVVSYILFVGVMYVTQRSQIYFPDPNRPSPALSGVPEMKTIHVQTEDGLNLEGWYKVPTEGKPVLLMFHGNAGNLAVRAFKARLLMDYGYGVLMAEYRGYGGNKGEPTEQGLYRDARAYMAWLGEQGIGADRIVLHGESLGTGVAVQMAMSHDPVRALILEMPYTSLAHVAQHHMFYLPAYFLLKDRYDNLAKIAKIHAPLLILHGTADFTVPYKQAKTLFSAANEPKAMETFKYGGHNNLYSLGAGTKIISFLETLD